MPLQKKACYAVVLHWYYYQGLCKCLINFLTPFLSQIAQKVFLIVPYFKDFYVNSFLGIIHFGSRRIFFEDF